MVFGNRGADSATGVPVHPQPGDRRDRLYGDVLFDAQGEDVVAGTHATEPIAVLDERLPTSPPSSAPAAARLERHYADLCDIEFTIEEGRLWMLQVRVGKRSPQAALRIAVDMAEDPTFPLTRREASSGSRRSSPIRRRRPGRTQHAPPLLTGLAASPGVASGPIVTTAEAAPDAAPKPGAGDPRPPRPRPTTSTAWPSRPAS